MSPSVAAVAKARAVLFIAFPPCLSAQAINVGSGVSRIPHDDFKCTTGAIGSVRAKAGGPEGADLSPRPLFVTASAVVRERPAVAGCALVARVRAGGRKFTLPLGLHLG